MSEVTLKTVPGAKTPVQHAAETTQQPNMAGGIPNVTLAQAVAEVSSAGARPAGYLDDKIEDAERLLGYAIAIGIEVEDDIRNAVLKARQLDTTGTTEPTAANLLSALTKLAGRVKPVTAESLRATADPIEAQVVIAFYIKVALVLIAFIIPFSLAIFISSAISDAIKKDLDSANILAVKLSDELGPPQVNYAATGERVGANTLPHGVTQIEVIRDLQQFAATIRAIDARARQLNLFVGYAMADPFAEIRRIRQQMKAEFELPPGLPDLPLAATQKIGVYQDVRYFAQTIQEAVATTYGAIATCILPVLYALLGTCAYLLRSFEEQIRTRTFTGANRHVARFLIAGIGGLVVGLFNNFNIVQGGTLPPLAIAFLVGYAVDIFFSFLEGFLQTFNQTRGPPSTQARQSRS